MSSADPYFSGDRVRWAHSGPVLDAVVRLAVAARFDGTTLEPRDPAATLYRELRPISAGFVAEAVAVTGLDRSMLER